MSRGRSWSEIRNNKVVTLWFAAALMTLLGAFSCASPALASTAGVAQASHHYLAVTPDIHSGSCTAARANWVHITFTAPTRGTTCYGGTGTITFSANDVSKFCPGNNDGAFTYMIIATGQDKTDNFEPGGGTLNFNPTVDAISLNIMSFSGNHPC
jgi:hypothetical protein